MKGLWQGDTTEIQVLLDKTTDLSVALFYGKKKTAVRRSDFLSLVLCGNTETSRKSDVSIDPGHEKAID